MTQTMYAQVAQNNRLLSDEETKYYLQIIHDYDEETDEYKNAMNELVLHNQKLILKFAHNFVASGYGEFDDLVQEGNLALMRAIKKFDLNKDIKLSTYATIWIKQFMSRNKKASELIHVPEHQKSNLATLKQIEVDLTEKLGRHPNDDELADAAPSSFIVANDYVNVRRRFRELNKKKEIKKLNKSESKEYKQLSQIIHDAKKDFILSLRQATAGCISLEQTLESKKGFSSTESILDHIADEHISPEEKALQSSQCDQIDKLLKRILTKQEKEVFCRFNGLNRKTETYQEIGNDMGFSKQRANQINCIAIQKIKKYVFENPTVLSECELDITYIQFMQRAER